MTNLDKDKFIGCIIGGAIGDAWGSSYENLPTLKNDEKTFYFGEKKEIQPIYFNPKSALDFYFTLFFFKFKHLLPF